MGDIAEMHEQAFLTGEYDELDAACGIEPSGRGPRRRLTTTEWLERQQREVRAAVEVFDTRKPEPKEG